MIAVSMMAKTSAEKRRRHQAEFDRHRAILPLERTGARRGRSAAGLRLVANFRRHELEHDSITQSMRQLRIADSMINSKEMLSNCCGNRRIKCRRTR